MNQSFFIGSILKGTLSFILVSFLAVLVSVFPDLNLDELALVVQKEGFLVKMVVLWLVLIVSKLLIDIFLIRKRSLNKKLEH